MGKWLTSTGDANYGSFRATESQSLRPQQFSFNPRLQLSSAAPSRAKRKSLACQFGAPAAIVAAAAGCTYTSKHTYDVQAHLTRLVAVLFFYSLTCAKQSKPHTSQS